MPKKRKLPAPAKISIAEESELSNEWMQREEVMKILQCSFNTLKKLRQLKLLPHSKICGKIYYNRVDVQNMLVSFRRYSLN